MSAPQESQKKQPYIVVDATDAVLGRLGSKVAKLLLLGERVVIVNAEKAVIVGDPAWLIERYSEKFDIHSRFNPRKGPFHFRRPDLFVKRTIRGMLPFKKPKGRLAYKRLRVYVGVPPEFSKAQYVRFEEALVTNKKKGKWIYVGDLLKHLGWKGIIRY